MKKIILIALIAMAFTLTACGEQQTNGPMFQPFIGGTQAIKMESVPGMPPTQVGAILDNGNSPFAIQARLTNVGEYDINTDNGDELFVELTGISASQFGITENDLVQRLDAPLPGARKIIGGNIQPGQSTVLTFEGLSYKADAMGDTPITYNLNLCYDYETKSTTQICMVGDVTGALVNTKQQEICKVNEQKEPHNSAGPVQVIEVNELPQGGSKVTLIIKIGHVGTGDIFKAGSENGCDYSIQNTDQNKVQLRVYLPDQSQATLECAGLDSTGHEATGEVTLYDGSSRTLTCNVESTASKSTYYQDLLGIEMRYRYGEILQNNIVITDMGVVS